MDVGRFLKMSCKRISSDGISGLREVLYRTYQGAWTNIGRHYNYGTNIYESDWDVLIVLDACRVDTLNQVAPEYDFLDRIDSTYSVGSASAEWMQKTFDESHRKEIQKTVYITGNPHSKEILRADDFLLLDEVWRYRWDEELGTVRPRSVTNQAVKHYRKKEPERMILHYMQPHFPSVPVPELGSQINPDTTGWESIWDDLRTGKVKKETATEAYVENLRYVMDDLEILLSNISADSVVLTSDHANLFGRFNLYGHPSYVPLRELKRVPWVDLEASDEKTYTPIEYDSPSETGVEEKLKTLGYL
ncbi:hypothetical protein [Halobaculum sp. EA56]|uniref:hypothetical protein n=1 Tax=Halobaculum sp. EA56 TaxID=3421648 RepID=UPI003EBF3379